MKKVIDELGGFKALATFLQQTAARAERNRDVFKGKSISLFYDGKADAYKLASKWLLEEIDNHEKGRRQIIWQ